MPTYIVLASYTQEGIQNVKESPGRLDATRQVFESMGAKVKDFYLVTGEYDMVLVGEFPDDETAAKLALTVGSTGAVRTVSLRAFTEAEYRKIIAGLP